MLRCCPSPAAGNTLEASPAISLPELMTLAPLSVSRARRTRATLTLFEPPRPRGESGEGRAVLPRPRAGDEPRAPHLREEPPEVEARRRLAPLRRRPLPHAMGISDRAWPERSRTRAGRPRELVRREHLLRGARRAAPRRTNGSSLPPPRSRDRSRIRRCVGAKSSRGARGPARRCSHGREGEAEFLGRPRHARARLGVGARLRQRRRERRAPQRRGLRLPGGTRSAAATRQTTRRTWRIVFRASLKGAYTTGSLGFRCAADSKEDSP